MVADFDYDAFGQLASGGPTPAAVDFLFGYAGGIFDGETGNQYHRARYYPASTGRFLSEDPIGFAGGDHNLYRYAEGNPLNRSDPSGLAAKYLGSVTAALTGMPLAGLGTSATYAAAFANSASAAQQPPSASHAGGSPLAGLQIPLTVQHGRQMREQEEAARFFGSLPPGTTLFSDANSYDYRRRQIERLGQIDRADVAILESFRVELSAALNRFVVGEARNPTLETPDQKRANDIADFSGNVGLLSLTAWMGARLPTPNQPQTIAAPSPMRTIAQGYGMAAEMPRTPLAPIAQRVPAPAASPSTSSALRQNILANVTVSAPRSAARGFGNIGSHGPVDPATALSSAEKFLGAGYKEIAPGIFRSADGLRQFRMTARDLLPTHGNIGPHVHFEALNTAGKVIENLHLPVVP